MENRNAFWFIPPLPPCLIHRKHSILVDRCFPHTLPKKCAYLLKDMVQDRQVCEHCWCEAEVKCSGKGSVRGEGRRSVAPARRLAAHSPGQTQTLPAA